MSVGDNFTENFTADFAVGIFQNVLNSVQSCFSSRIYQLLLKVISLQEKSTESFIFWKSKETRRVKSCLTYCSQKKNE